MGITRDDDIEALRGLQDAADEAYEADLATRGAAHGRAGDQVTAPTKAERERLRGLLASGSPGPWVHAGDSYVVDTEQGFLSQMGTTEDAALIAAAVNALPGLLDALATAEARVAKLEGVVECARASVEINQALGDKAAENMQRLATAEAERLTLARVLAGNPGAADSSVAFPLARRIVNEANGDADGLCSAWRERERLARGYIQADTIHRAVHGSGVFTAELRKLAELIVAETDADAAAEARAEADAAKVAT
jgi:hypothetical protein